MDCVSPSFSYGSRIFVTPKAGTFSVLFHTESQNLKPNQFQGLGSLQFCAYRGLYFGCYPYKRSVVRNSYRSAPSSFLFIPRKHYSVPRRHFQLKEELCESHHNNELQSLHKLSKHMAVRSGLAEMGASGAGYPSSEFHLGSKVRGICFYAVTAFHAIFLFLLMLVGHPFVMLLDHNRRKFHHFIAKIWAMLTVAPFFKIKFEGLENLPPSDTPAVYVSNHQSFLDIYTLLTLGRCFKFISKTAIFIYPVVGWAMFLLGTIPLKRMDSRSQLETFKRCMDLIKKGASVFFFPEGTRSKDGKLGAFKKGAFSIAAKTKAPVVPITLIGPGQIMPAGMENIVNFGSVKVVIHEPIKGSDANILCKEARKRIASALNHQD
ncbi:1-acyl-sn-glycerol-3-phosphate acyltransferase [Quillaja saponaria]|uniref:1-acyl-sn-glycerol-3-phosphate acyltransferase n=1 Tax=Quillaja saponaria TaxID=32244 RepID=A0AAD7QE17_QUISA|nr:1-acyl-sn-glycerol-3-phosphate acyltransferase [Quillaja saponaria]